MPQRAPLLKVNCCLKVHDAHQNYYRQFRDKHWTKIQMQTLHVNKAVAPEGIPLFFGAHCLQVTIQSMNGC